MNTAALENMKTRRSCRVFSDRMPERELVEAICEAGTYAPTGHGRQSPVILAVTDRALRDRLSRMNAAIMGTEGDPFYGAPVVLVVVADRSVVTAEYDGCCVMANLLNAAHAVGLDSCWIHRAKEEFESAEGKEILRAAGLEGDYVGVGHCILGYGMQAPSPARPRKADYVRWI